MASGVDVKAHWLRTREDSTSWGFPLCFLLPLNPRQVFAEEDCGDRVQVYTLPSGSVQSYRTLLEFASSSSFSQPFSFVFPAQLLKLLLSLRSHTQNWIARSRLTCLDWHLRALWGRPWKNTPGAATMTMRNRRCSPCPLWACLNFSAFQLKLDENWCSGTYRLQILKVWGSTSPGGYTEQFSAICPWFGKSLGPAVSLRPGTKLLSHNWSILFFMTILYHFQTLRLFFSILLKKFGLLVGRSNAVLKCIYSKMNCPLTSVNKPG